MYFIYVNMGELRAHDKNTVFAFFSQFYEQSTCNLGLSCCMMNKNRNIRHAMEITQHILNKNCSKGAPYL
jgi:hypothetical protein